MEGAGILSQVRFEKVARQEGLDIRINFMASAIDGLQMDLQGTGRAQCLPVTDGQSVQSGI